MPLAHEGFARVASSILLLRAGECFEGFDTARVKGGGVTMSAAWPLSIPLRKSS
jgi:hypothetical protein